MQKHLNTTPGTYQATFKALPAHHVDFWNAHLHFSSSGKDRLLRHLRLGLMIRIATDGSMQADDRCSQSAVVSNYSGHKKP